ncbi:hypothetical protein [Ideonella sp. BN130291]|uniref:hypothetical protein n=1 Tax=Ideonella sp. BN130291 TaxID=3112940 RepID=UPI002E2739F7|nr:hypothetical protein [Ideonella sp. BN130291]
MFLLLASLCTTAQAASLSPLAEREFNAVALRAESQVRHEMNQPLQVQFHRDQGFRWRGEGARSAAIVSLLVMPEGQPAHCVLAVEREGRLQTLDALATDAQQPWSCDGEPALTLADVDGDGAPDLLVLYPYRAPSNDTFQLPLVLRHRQDKGDFELEAERTRWLREGHRLPATLVQMKQALKAYPRPK